MFPFNNNQTKKRHTGLTHSKKSFATFHQISPRIVSRKNLTITKQNLEQEEKSTKHTKQNEKTKIKKNEPTTTSLPANELGK